MKLDDSIDLNKTETDARATAYAAAEYAIRAIRPLTADVIEMLNERDDEADALRSALGKLAAARCAAGLDAHNRHLARISADRRAE
jgi:hypothetical protein